MSANKMQNWWVILSSTDGVLFTRKTRDEASSAYHNFTIIVPALKCDCCGGYLLPMPTITEPFYQKNKPCTGKHPYRIPMPKLKTL